MTENVAPWLNQFVVVETDGDAYIGTLEKVDAHRLVVRTGFVGRPSVIDVEDVESITPAEQHPLVA